MFELDQSKLLKSGKLFPSHDFINVQVAKKKQPPIQRNGGWGDLRDILLCKSFTKNALHIDMSWMNDIS